ncbi:MAG TPA: YceD family protein [Candidatus Acidoferrum sp.]|nr:YceD family protein [Candidatus Acidoferrum sp.]
MPLLVNLRHLQAHDAHLKGELSVEDLDIDSRDEVIQVTQPLRYDLEVQKVEGGLLVQGKLHLLLDCQCVRCLKAFQQALDLKPWTILVPLEGEEKAPVVSDCVDLTPFVREDILLEFPRHPLCNAQCRGLPKAPSGNKHKPGGPDPTDVGSPAWAELNKLKF